MRIDMGLSSEFQREQSRLPRGSAEVWAPVHSYRRGAIAMQRKYAALLSLVPVARPTAESRLRCTTQKTQVIHTGFTVLVIQRVKPSKGCQIAWRSTDGMRLRTLSVHGMK